MGLYGQLLSIENEQTPRLMKGVVDLEVKIRIKEEEKDRLLKKLSLSRFVYEADQRELYLNNPHKSFFFKNSLGFLDANEYLRLRESKILIPSTDDTPQMSLCYKRVHRDEGGEYLYCDEYETRISSAEQALRLFQNLGFTDIYRVEKRRRVYAYDNYSICLDELSQFGCFLEVEVIHVRRHPKEEVEGIRAFIVNILGIHEFDEQTHGYLSMVVNPHYDFGKKGSYVSSHRP